VPRRSAQITRPSTPARCARIGEHADIVERIAIDDHEIGEATLLDRASSRSRRGTAPPLVAERSACIG